MLKSVSRPGFSFGRKFSFSPDGKNFIGNILITGSGETSTLWNFEINSEFRGQGFGFQFLSEIIEQEKTLGKEIINLAVKKNNLVARKLYLKAGFIFLEPEENSEEEPMLSKDNDWMELRLGEQQCLTN